MKKRVRSYFLSALCVSLGAAAAVHADYEKSVMLQNPAVYYRFNTTEGEEPNLGWLDAKTLTFNGDLVRGAEGPNLPGFEAENRSLELKGGYGQFGPLGINVSELTIVAWLKSPATRTQHQPGIVFSRGSSATGIEFKTTTYNLGYHWLDTGVSMNYATGPAAEAQQWNMLAVSVKGDASNFYIGVSDGSIRTGSNNVALNPATLNDPFYIGQDVVNGAVRSLTANDGPASIDEVAIFTRALSAEDIEMLFSTGRGIPVAPTQVSIVPDVEVVYGGGTNTLTVVGNGTADSIVWEKDGTPIDFDGLVLTSPEAGVYTVTVSNSAGSLTSEPFEVLEPAAPKFTVQPEGGVRYLHGRISMSAEAIGTTPFSYQWKLNGEEIEGATESTLEVELDDPSQFGNYTVVISNRVGATESANAVVTLETCEENSYAAAVMELKPVAFWRLDDVLNDNSSEYDEESYLIITGTAVDMAGGNHGLYLGVLNSAKIDGAIASDSNKAIHFNGFSGVKSDLQLNSYTNGFTVAGWIKHSLDYGAYTTNAGYFGQNDLFEIGDASGNRVQSWLKSIGNGDKDSAYIMYPFADNEWGQIVVTYDTEQMIIYANGVSMANFNGTSPLTAGKDYGFNIAAGVRDALSATFQNFFVGDIDDVAVFDRGLSKDEVRGLYNAGYYGGAQPPVIETQPMGISGYENAERVWSINPVVGGTEPFAYQWYKNGTAIEGATNLVLNGVFVAEDEGSYTVEISNDYGKVTSAAAVVSLHIPAVNSYEESVYLMDPYAYWRLGETSGTTAYDYAGGKNGVYTSFMNQGVAGAINGDSDRAVNFIGQDQIVTEPLGLTNTANVTFAAWFRPTGKLGASDKTTLLYNRSGTSDKSATGIDIAAGQLAYHWADGHFDWRSGLYPVINEWNFIVMAISPTNAVFYLGDKDGNLKFVNRTATHDPANLLARFTIGGDSFYGERKVEGDIDEAVVFDRTLTEEEVINLYNLGFMGSESAPKIQEQPVGVDAYYQDEGLSVSAVIRGVEPLSYQWYKDGEPVPGANSLELNFEGLTEESGEYYLEVSNPWGSAVSETISVQIDYLPYSVDLSEGLVAHYKFENNYEDSSANGYHGTAVGEPTFLEGPVGSALHVSTFIDETSGVYDANYVQLPYNLSLEGTPLTVAFWTRLGDTSNRLPWLTSGDGYDKQGITFCPSTQYGWSWSIRTVTDVSRTDTSRSLRLPADEWHHLVFAMDPGVLMYVYLDGVYIGSVDLSTITPADMPMSPGAIIGQGVSGYLIINTEYDIDDMGIWNRVLSNKEARSIYAVAQNGFSFDGVVSEKVVPQILEQPKGFYGYVCPGTTYKVSVDIASPYPREVVWYKEGEATEFVGESVNIPLTAENAGTWIARVTNDYGTVDSDEFTIELFEPEPDSYEALILDLAPYSYWRLGETEGNIAYDYVGNRHGIYTENNTLGMPGAIQGDTDGSVGFNGVDQILAPPTELVTDKITLMAWLYPTSELRSSLIYDRIGIGYAKWVVGLGVNNGQLMYHWNDGQSGYASGLRPRLNEWNFAAITVEPERAILYLGNMDGTLTTATNIATHVETEMRYATALGGDPWYTDRKVIGQLDEAAIFNHTLSPEEVESVFRKGLGSTGAELILNFGLSSEGNLTLSWESEDAVLESAETTQGPWIPVESIELGVKEAVIPLSETAGFYRLRVD